jgi:hypothetical protein
MCATMPTNVHRTRQNASAFGARTLASHSEGGVLMTEALEILDVRQRGDFETHDMVFMPGRLAGRMPCSRTCSMA